MVRVYLICARSNRLNIFSYARKVAALRVEFALESSITVRVVGEEAGRRLMNMFDSDGVRGRWCCRGGGG
jgi:hypothetical protein